jgi:muramoyltetrapeptide carboxypeptidase
MNVSLKKGDTIGIVAPSAPISAFCPRRTERGIEALKKLGFKVKLGKTAKKVHNFTAGTAEERVKDIHTMFVDPKVKAIMATIGGFNANDLLDKLDYTLIKDNNKLFIGYSDMTVLLCALYEKSNVPTIMGPMLLPQFGEYPGILDFTKESFLQVVTNLGTKQQYKLPWSLEMTEEMLWWDKKDNRKRKMKKNSGWQIIQKGKADGHLMAANLNTLLRLAGTKYFPKLRGSVLFLEDDSDESAATVMRMLIQLRHMGVFKNVKGLVFGRFQEKSEIDMTLFKEMIDNALEGAKMPVIANGDFGHTDPMLSLPIGKKVLVNTDNNEIRIVL